MNRSDLEKYSPDKGIRLLFQELFISVLEAHHGQNTSKLSRNTIKILGLIKLQYERIEFLQFKYAVDKFIERFRDEINAQSSVDVFTYATEKLDRNEIDQYTFKTKIESFYRNHYGRDYRQNGYPSMNPFLAEFEKDNPLWDKTRGISFEKIVSDTYGDLEIEILKQLEDIYDDWLNDKDRTPWDPSQDIIEKTELRIFNNLNDKEENLSEKEKLYNILKLQKSDMRGRDGKSSNHDISKDWDDIFEVCRLITEISRFAILDLGSERDDKDEYVSFLSNDGSDEQIFGNKSFHTSSFRHWVRNKSYAILTTYGFSKEMIDRGLNAILTIDAKKKREDGDAFISDIYNLGELMHISKGVNKPTLSRLVELKEESVYMIVSSLPTHELRMIDPEIFIEGSMRFTQSEKLAEFLPIQTLETYSQPPLRLSKIFEEDSVDKQKELAKKLLIEQSLGLKLDEIYRPDDGQTFEYVKDKEKFILHQEGRGLKLDRLPLMRNFGVIRIKEQFKSNRYYIIKSDNRKTYADAEYYSIPPTYWRYICRIFHGRPKLEFKIDDKNVIIRVDELLPSRGQRVMASTQCLGRWVKRSSDFKLVQSTKKGDGSSSKLEWEISFFLWDSYVKRYLTRYCLYELEEIK